MEIEELIIQGGRKRERERCVKWTHLFNNLCLMSTMSCHTISTSERNLHIRITVHDKCVQRVYVFS